MAEIELGIGGRHYMVACRDGGEDHLRHLAQHVDRKAQEARAAVGNVNETRQLLFAALLLADELAEAREALQAARVDTPDPRLTSTLTALAERIEAIADSLETGTETP